MKTPFDDLLPDILYETYCLEKPNRICLVCGSGKAISVLRTIEKEIAPICKDCAFGWNFYGYEILKKIKPKKLIWNLIKFKLRHPFFDSWITIYKSMQTMQAWSARMKKWAKSRKEDQ